MVIQTIRRQPVADLIHDLVSVKTRQMIRKLTVVDLILLPVCPVRTPFYSSPLGERIKVRGE